jgi:cbb3-type cytochrome oxidase subunit 3
MSTANFHSLLTLIGIISFIAMVIWVFGKKQRTQMDQHALIPLSDDRPIPGEQARRIS